MNAQPFPVGDSPVETMGSRQRILDYLSAQGGSVESPEGRGLTKQMAEAVGYDELSALNAMLGRLETEGVITRDVRGRRTYRIALLPWEGRQGEIARAPRTGPRSRGVEEELRHPRGHLKLAVLLLLAERKDHGYDLVARLKPFGYENDDPARTYRALHWLEHAGLVVPQWETSGAGPARRVYEITAEGRRVAALVSGDLRERGRVFEQHLTGEQEPRLRVVDGHGIRAFEVLVEAKLSVRAPDDATARQAAEQALGAERTIDENVTGTGQVWVYDVRGVEEA